MNEFEVYIQRRPGHPMRHVGSVRGLTPTLALHNAKEVFTRRDPTHMLVVRDREDPSRRAELGGDGHDDLFRLSYGREYRQPRYFSEKWQGRAVSRPGAYRDLDHG